MITTETRTSWRAQIEKYQTPSVIKSSWQLVNSLIPYFFLLTLMVYSLDISYWLTLGLSLPTAGFLVRIFIINHDCGHGSFFSSERANAFWGSITAFLCFCPFYFWKHEHAIHHLNTGNLDRRGHGDIWTMTVNEYQMAPWRTRLFYRIYRNPIVLFSFGALYIFIVDYRFAIETPQASVTKKIRKSVNRTNFALFLALLLAHFTVGLKAFLLVQLPVLFLTTVAGGWMFYVQHQFEGVYWARKKEWDYLEACLAGSSFYNLNSILTWFTGSIGFHHIHHLSSKIPNYNLKRCHKENEIFQRVSQLTLLSSFRCLSLRLWDEQKGKLVGYPRMRA
jgi:omega-6 fatty acid desaturase (delta-12 desaturase)